MRTKAEQLKKGVSLVTITTNRGGYVGTVTISKSKDEALEYLKTSIGVKHQEYEDLLTRCARIEAAWTPKTKTKKKGISFLVREAFDAGCKLPEEVFTYLEKKDFKYRQDTAYSLIWEERSKRGLGALRPRMYKS